MSNLVEIAPSCWPELRDLYVDSKNMASAYQLLENFIDWTNKGADIKVKIFALDGTWQQDGTFLLVDEIGQLTQVYFNTLDENKTERLSTALKCLDNKKGFLLSAFQNRFMDVLENYLLECGLPKEEIRHEATVWVSLPKGLAENFTIKPPAGYTLAALQLSNAEQVNNIWPHRAPGSIAFVERLINYNESVGVFNDKGELVAWCLRLPLGSLGLLQVEEPYKRKGFGSLVVRYMSKLLAEKNNEVMAPVVVKNIASRSMFEKLGFVVIDKVCWTMKPAQ